jgi:VIT1/CCC1 family predicted Fe2+/Mn2+ transporter
MNNKVVNKDPTTQRESLTELLGQLANNSAAVFHDEIELVVQRIREEVRADRSGVLTVATGAVISFAAFLSLCAALIIALTSYMTPVIASLVTGAALALIGIVIVVIGYKQLKKSILKTEKAVQSP